MIEFLASTILANNQARAISNPEDVNKVCAYLVGIPYASDNFDDNEWKRFVLCKKLIENN